MKKTALTLIFAFLFLVSAFTGLGSFNLVSANPGGSFPVLAMPVEYVNYTITPINGTLWAKIDGNYPISILTQSDCNFNGDLPMVYPMPPGATNIHVFLGEQELNWTNYTQGHPEADHHTAIGDWGMISCKLSGVSGAFVLRIHYEHPLQMVNGSYLFLYDLNISPYLSEKSNNSTCNYSVRMQTNTTNLHAYTTKTDSQWNPINFAISQEGTTQVILIQEHSEYNKPLLGDLVVEFSSAEQVPEFAFWTVPALIIAILAAVLFLQKSNILHRH